MLGTSHRAIGTASWVIAAAVAHHWGHDAFTVGWTVPIGGWVLTDLPITTALATLGSLLPDIDTPHSRIAHMRVGGVKVFQPIAKLSSTLISHRGVTHTGVSLAAITVVGMLLGRLAAGAAAGVGLPLHPAAPALPLAAWGIALGWGYASHLAADGLTRHGVPFFWPLAKGDIGFPPNPGHRFVTGSWAEWLVVLLVVASLLLAVVAWGVPIL